METLRGYLRLVFLYVALVLSSAIPGQGHRSPGRRSRPGKLVCPPGAIETDNAPQSLPVPGKRVQNHTECYVQVKPGCYMVGRCLSRQGIQGMPGLCQTLDRKYIGLQAAVCATAPRARLHRADSYNYTPDNANDTVGAAGLQLVPSAASNITA